MLMYIVILTQINICKKYKTDNMSCDYIQDRFRLKVIIRE